jgi:hypothetical protein
MENSFINEEWKPIINYEGLYEVSNWGRVKSLARIVIYPNGVKHPYKETFLVGRVEPKKGYTSICLYKDSKRKYENIHRLVALHFIPNPNNYLNVLHKIESFPSNNHVDNLFWGTQDDNIKDKVSKQRQTKGEGQHLSVLKENQVIEIREKYSTNNYSYKNLSDEYNVTRGTISFIVKRKTWKHI